MARSKELPEGEVTFVFSDVEGSTRLLERNPGLYGTGLARHHDLLADAVERHGGVVFETIGDAVYAAFADAASAVEAAAAGQLALLEEDWGDLGELRVRMGVHTGQVERRGAHYFGAALYRCARLMATAHGGQVVLSEAAAERVRHALRDGARLLDLGQHRLKDMLEPERVFQLVRPPLPSEFPALRSVDGRPHNLPAEVKSFVGRQEELAWIRELLLAPEVRVVTLTGPGGSGKTRLALRAAKELLDPFRDGVFVVELTPLADAAHVPPAIAHVLGVQETGGRPLVDSLATALAGKELLLVLDNCEHVLNAAPDVAALLAAAARLRILATSRVPLRIQGEHELEVVPLPVAEPDAPLDELVRSPSVQLFRERAREIRGDFGVTEANAAAVAEICARLDGLPLAIELAAARTRLLPPEALLERLESRLGLLTGGSRDLPSRQRTLRDAISWSYDLLDESVRELFRRLAVFRGGASLDAVERVCGGSDVLGNLTSLAEHSLIKVRWTELGEPRFEMLETIAEFAHERLAESGEAEELARRHAEHYAGFAESVGPHLHTDARRPWLLRLGDERDNIRAALSWAERNDEAETGFRILAALWLWYWLSFGESLSSSRRLLALPSAAEPSVAKAGAAFLAALCAGGAGDFEQLREYGEEAARVSREVGDERWLALALVILSAAYDDGAERAAERGAEAIAVAAATRDPWLLAWTKMIVALGALMTGRPEPARALASDAVAAFGELGDSWSRGSSSLPLGLALLQLGELEAAGATLAEAVPPLLDVRDLKMANGCLIALGMVLRFGGDEEGAEAAYARALALCAEAGDPANAPLGLEGLAAVVAGRDPERAVRLLGAAHALFESGNVPSVPGFEALAESTRDRLDEALGERLEPLLAEGRAAASMPLAELAAI